MFGSLLPSRTGFALALAALLVPIAISWALTTANRGGSHESAARASAADNRLVEPTRMPVRADPWCRSRWRLAAGTVTCQGSRRLT
jgi:hypothetical protein